MASDSEFRSSQSLISGVRNNETIAWEQFVNLYSPLIYYWCQKSGLPPQEIADVFQETLHSVAKNIDKYENRKGGTFRGWLRTMTRNKAFDHFRKKAREPQPVGGTEAQQMLQEVKNPTSAQHRQMGSDSYVSDDTEQKLFRDALKMGLSNIQPHFKPKTWQAFWLVVMEGRPTDDVANELGMKPGAVRVAKSRVLKRLRLQFGESND